MPVYIKKISCSLEFLASSLRNVFWQTDSHTPRSQGGLSCTFQEGRAWQLMSAFDTGGPILYLGTNADSGAISRTFMPSS